MYRLLILAMFLVPAAPALAEMVTSEFFSLPPVEGWDPLPQDCKPVTCVENGLYIQDLDLDTCIPLNSKPILAPPGNAAYGSCAATTSPPAFSNTMTRISLLQRNWTKRPGIALSCRRLACSSLDARTLFLSRLSSSSKTAPSSGHLLP